MGLLICLTAGGETAIICSVSDTFQRSSMKYASFGDGGRRPVRAGLLLLLTGTVLVVIGCDPTVPIVDPSETYRYSLFGTLDVNADTQVVRVEPLADTTQVGSVPQFSGTVILENLDTGMRVVLRDSFVTVGRTAGVHNFWTTHSIQPATTYRLAVRSGGEAVTTVRTTTPANSPAVTASSPLLLPCIFDQSGRLIKRKNTFTLRISAPERLVALQVLYPIVRRVGSGSSAPADSLSIPFGHLDEVPLNGVPQEEPEIFYGGDLRSLSGTRGCLGRSSFFRDHVLVAVARGGPDWPDWLGVSLDELARPDTFSNVEGGHGFVGGIYSDTISVPIRGRR